jgi:O-antigen ligase
MLPAVLMCLSFALKTGSRGALIALVLTYLFVVFTARGKYRMVVAVAVPLAGAAFFAVLSGELTARLATIISSSEQASGPDGGPSEAAASADGRIYLLKRGIELTLQHPFLGVGMGAFSVAEGSTRAGGVTGQWMAPHNSYTQLSSETGVPGLLLLLSSLGGSFGICWRVRKQALVHGNMELAAAAYTLAVSFVLFCVSAFFLSMAYRFYFPTLGGLAVALAGVARHELASRPAGSAGIAA